MNIQLPKTMADLTELNDAMAMIARLTQERDELRTALAEAHERLNLLSTPQAIEDQAEGQRFRKAREREASKLVTEVLKAWYDLPLPTPVGFPEVISELSSPPWHEPFNPLDRPKES